MGVGIWGQVIQGSSWSWLEIREEEGKWIHPFSEIRTSNQQGGGRVAGWESGASEREEGGGSEGEGTEAPQIQKEEWGMGRRGRSEMQLVWPGSRSNWSGGEAEKRTIRRISTDGSSHMGASDPELLMVMAVDRRGGEEVDSSPSARFTRRISREEEGRQGGNQEPAKGRRGREEGGKGEGTEVMRI